MRARESLALFMYGKPTAAKRLHFDVIPRTVDDYLDFPRRLSPPGSKNAQLGNPVWHIHAGDPPPPEILRAAAGGGCDERLLQHAAQPRRGGEQRGAARALGLPAPLCAGRVATDPPAARWSSSPTPRVSSAISCGRRKTYRAAGRGGTRGLARKPRRSSSPACRPRRRPEDITDGALRHRPADSRATRILPPRARPLSAPGVLERLVRDALCRPARRGEGPALRFVRRALWGSMRRGR